MGSESYLVGGAKLYFDAGGNTGFRDLGNIAESPSLTKAVTELEHYTAASGKKLLDKKIVLSAKIGLKFNLDEFDADNLDLVFLGDGATDASYNSGNVTDEVVTGYHDRIFFTAKGNISSVVITDSTGVTTYDVGDDYEIVDAVAGAIKILSSGDITDEQSLKVDYAYAASTAKKVKPGKTFSVDGKARLLFKAANGKNLTWVIANCNLKADGDVSLLSEDWSNASFVLDVLYDSANPTEPYGYLLVG